MGGLLHAPGQPSVRKSAVLPGSGATDSEYQYTAVPYDELRAQLLYTRARRRIVVLDCCYAARTFTIDEAGDASGTVAREAIIDGTYVIAGHGRPDRPGQGRFPLPLTASTPDLDTDPLVQMHGAPQSCREDGPWGLLEGGGRGPRASPVRGGLRCVSRSREPWFRGI
jgi:hypothetical protein